MPFRTKSSATPGAPPAVQSPPPRPQPRATVASALAVLVALAAPLAVPDGWIERAISQARAPSTMGVDEIRPGMRGYGLTVFRGTQPERFDVEVIDVLHNFRPDQDLVLIRTEHPILAEANTVGGMSGSPIFIEDRMIGAYAYGWTFGRHPVAGVTPIESMMRELRRTPRAGAFPGATPLASLDGTTARRTTAGARHARALPAGVAPYLGTSPRTAFSAIEERATHPVTLDEGTLVPASTPLLVGGLDASVVEGLRARLEPLGLDVLQAGGAGTPPTPATASAARFVDGGAIAVTLARGDIASTAVGTVTHVEGSRLVAFGHPMVEGGEVGFPTAVARVLHVLASYQRSFKIAEPVAPLGTLVEDRQAAIVVDTSLQAAMIPVHVHVGGVPTEQRTDWNFEVASHRALTPMLIASSIQSAVKAIAADNDDVMFEARTRIELEGRAPIEVVDRGFSSSGAAQPSALSQLRAFDLLEVAYANPFEETRIRSLDVEIELRFAHETAEIIDARVESTEVNPGAPVTIRAVLRHFDGHEEVRHYRVDIPESAAGQSIQVLLQPGPDAELERPEPRSLDDVLEAVRNRFGATDLVLSMRLATRGMRLPGHVVRSVPSSVLDALQSTTDADRARAFQTHVRRAYRHDFVLTGGARVELSVRRVAEETR